MLTDHQLLAYLMMIEIIQTKQSQIIGLMIAKYLEGSNMV
jgi:hypothetical protein